MSHYSVECSHFFYIRTIIYQHHYFSTHASMCLGHIDAIVPSWCKFKKPHHSWTAISTSLLWNQWPPNCCTSSNAACFAWGVKWYGDISSPLKSTVFKVTEFLNSCWNWIIWQCSLGLCWKIVTLQWNEWTV